MRPGLLALYGDDPHRNETNLVSEFGTFADRALKLCGFAPMLRTAFLHLAAILAP